MSEKNKDAKRIIKSMPREVVAEEGIAEADPKKQSSGLSDTFTAALANFVPIIAGGLIGGSEGASNAYQGAQSGMDAMQQRNLSERKMRLGEEQLEQQGEIQDRSLDIREEEQQIQRDALAQRRQDNIDRMRQQDEVLDKRLSAQEKLQEKEFRNQLTLQGVRGGQQVAKESRKELSTLTKNEQDAQESLKKLLNIKDKFEKFSKEKLGGTGPISTLGGLTQYVSEGTQDLEASFRQAGLEEMARLFDGMSKAIDSDAERRAFEAAQPSLINDDQVNRNILQGRIEATESLLRKIQQQKQALGKGQPAQPSQDVQSILQQIQQIKGARRGSK